MDRKQFLGVLGAGALVLTGISGVLGGLSKLGGHASHGYGHNTYGQSATKSPSSKRQLG